MKYLFYEKESGTKAKVNLIYNVKPPQELLAKDNYIKHEEIPETEQKDGKISTLYCNPSTKELWYEYEDIPKIQEEIQQEKIESLEQSIAELTMAMTMMGGM